jgi:hypothetical protein
MKNFLKSCVIFLTSLSLLSCASYDPILNQNEKYLRAGKEQADQDIKLCKKAANEYLDQYKAKRAAKEAGRKAIIGGVVGAASGAIWGRSLKSAAIGTAIGAGVGAAIGGLSVAGEDKVKPDKIKQRYVSSCLGKEGYEVLGWE